MYVAMYLYVTSYADFISLHVTHLSFLSSLFTIARSLHSYLEEVYSTYFPSVAHMNLKCYQLAMASKQPKNCALRIHMSLYSFTSFTCIYSYIP